MGRPTKKEQAARAKAEAAKKSSNEDLIKKQQELAKKAEERNKRKAAEIADKNLKNSQKNEVASDNTQQNQSTEISNNVSNDIPEQSNIQVTNNSVSSNQTPISEVSTETTEEVSEVDADSDMPDVSQDMDIPEEIMEELEATTEQQYDVPDDDFDPLKEKVIHRTYTDGNLGAKKQDNISSDSNSSGTTNPNGSTVPPQPQIEPEIAEPIIKQTEPQVGLDDDKKVGDSSSDAKKDIPKTPPVNPKLDDLSPSQKRKAAEKTADALITTYANLIPIPFKKISSFNIRKLENRHLKDEIDMHSIIMEDGTTIRSYCEGVNAQVEATFVITKEMQEEIKTPLVDVLIENNFALTPLQQLGVVVGGQILQMGINAVQFMHQNGSAMETFKKFHEENKAIKAEATYNEPTPTYTQSTQTATAEEPLYNTESKKTTTSSNVKDSSDIPMDIPSDKEDSDDNKITVEEFLSKD